MSKILLVTISTMQYIPFIGRKGPIRTPIAVEESIVRDLRKIGFDVREHAPKNVVIQPSGVRALVDGEVFESASKLVESEEILAAPVIDTEPAIVAPQPVDEVLVTETTLLEETPVEEPEDEQPEEETEQTEEDELVVYPEAQYNSWTKAQLDTYLANAHDYLPDEIVAELGHANRKRLLAIVKEHIVDAATDEDAE